MATEDLKARNQMGTEKYLL